MRFQLLLRFPAIQNVNRTQQGRPGHSDPFHQAGSWRRHSRPLRYYRDVWFSVQPDLLVPLPMPDSLNNSDPPGSLPRVTPTPTSAYVREAKPSEMSALADVYARAFARDPMMNWFGGVRALVPADHYKAKADGDGVDASVRRTLAGLRHFQLLLTKMARILGLIVVVVEKDSEGEGERIVGGALWLKPGASLDPSPRTLLRISPWRVIWSWGLGVLKVCRVFYVFLRYVLANMHHPPPLRAPGRHPTRRCWLTWILMFPV